MKKAIFATLALLAMSVSATDSATIAANFLKTAEGFKNHVYTCAAGKKTIGYGFTDKATVAKGYISKVAAERKLFLECKGIQKKVRKELKGITLTDSQEAAIISFVFNVGMHNFKSSTMCKLLKANNKSLACRELAKWVYITSNGKKVKSKGLTNRRAKEAALFLKV